MMLVEFGACADAVLHEQTSAIAAAAKKLFISPPGNICEAKRRIYPGGVGYNEEAKFFLYRGLNLGKETPRPVSSKRPATGMPVFSFMDGQPTTFLQIPGPSARSI